MLLTKRLKDLATAAFRDNAKLSRMSVEDREASALEYEQQARNLVGIKVNLAHLYNLERAKFLRGEVDYIARSAPDYAEEIGYSGVDHP